MVPLLHGPISEYAMSSMTDVNNEQQGPRVEPVWDRNQPARDEMSPRGISGALRGLSGSDWLLYGAVAAVALAIGVVNALSIAQDAAWHGGAYDVRTPLLWEMSSIVVIVLVAPILFVAANQRLRRAIMDENGGGAGRFVRVSPRAIVLRLTNLRWLATPISSPARAA